MAIGWNTDTAPAGPALAYELDWTALASQLGIADGTVTIDGIDWTADNAANATLFQILADSGLQITSAAGVNRDWDGASPSAPGLFVPLVDLAESLLRYDLPLTVWSHFSAYSIPVAQNAVTAGVWSPQTPYSAVNSGACFYRSASAGTGIRRGSSFNLAADPDAAADVLVWRSPVLGTAEVYSGVWSDGWPERDALRVVGHDVSGYGTTLSSLLVLRRAGACLVYSAETGAATGAPSFTLAHTRIEIG